jgi:hypothetical protein
MSSSIFLLHFPLVMCSNFYNRDRIEVEHKYLLVLDPADSQRPKPSPEAKPLPEHLNNNKNVNASNRQDGVPEVGDPFHDPDSEQKWAEWHAANSTEIRNAFQVKVDMSKSDKLWHYLGKTSTEARAQYTSDPKITTHNPKSNFLDTVKPSPAKITIPPQRVSYPGGSYQRPFPTSYPSSYSGAYSTSFAITAAAAHGPNGAGTVYRPPQSQQHRPVQQHKSQHQSQHQHARPQTLQQQQSPQVHDAAKPYAYKPKTEMLPNAPRPFQYGSQPGVPGFAPIQSRPPPSTHNAATSGPPSSEYPVGSTPSFPQYSQSQPRAPSAQSPSPGPVRLDNSPPYRHFYQQAEQRYAQPKALDVRYRCLASPKPTPPLPAGAAPIANMLGPTVAAPFTPPSQRGHSATISTNETYISHIMKYPYLKNAFLRRPKNYTSPYASGGGFAPEYQAKLLLSEVNTNETSSSYQPSQPSNSATPAYSPSQSQSRSQAHSELHSPHVSQSHSPHSAHNPIPQQPPRSHLVRYETAQQFQENVHRETDKASSPVGSKFDFLINQINQSKNRPSSSTSSSHESNHPKSNHSITMPEHQNNNTAPTTLPQYPIPPPPSSYFSAGLPKPPSYSLPPLQPLGYSGHSAPSGMTRTSSGGPPAGYAPASQPSQTTHIGPSNSYTPRMRSPERPDYSPLSETLMMDAPPVGVQPRPPTSMQVQNMLSHADQGKDHYPRVAHEYSQQQHPQNHHQDKRAPVGLGLEGYKMS